MYSTTKNPRTKLTLESWEKTHSFEAPYSDMDTTELIEAFYDLMVSATFSEVDTLETMRDFAEEKLACLKPELMEE